MCRIFNLDSVAWPPAFCRLPPAALMVLSLVGLAGCDLAGYEAKFQVALKAAAEREVFDRLLHQMPTEVTDAKRKGAGVSFRLPKIFDKDAKSLAATEPRAALTAAPIELSYALERQLDDDASKWLPVYAYFAVVPKAEQKPDALQTALSQAAGAPASAWSDVQLKTPEGKTVALKRLRVEGQQPFSDLQKNPPAAVRADGRLDVYLIDAGDNSVLIGFRGPKAQSQKHQFDAATEAAMGTLNVTATPTLPAKGGAPKPAT